jgi:NTE family protein
MDNYSYDSVTKLREALYARVQDQENDEACVGLLGKYCVPRPTPFAGNIDPYLIEINFEAVRLIAIGPKLLQVVPQNQCMRNVLAAESEGPLRPEECPPGAGIFP